MAGEMFMAKRFWIFLAIFVVALTFGLILFVPAVSPKIDETMPRRIEYHPTTKQVLCSVTLLPSTKYEIIECTFVATLYGVNHEVLDRREITTTNRTTQWTIENGSVSSDLLEIDIINVKTNSMFDLILSIILICGAGVALWFAIQSKRKERKEIEDAWREKYKKEPEQ